MADSELQVYQQLVREHRSGEAKSFGRAFSRKKRDLRTTFDELRPQIEGGILPATIIRLLPSSELRARGVTGGEIGQRLRNSLDHLGSLLSLQSILGNEFTKHDTEVFRGILDTEIDRLKKTLFQVGSLGPEEERRESIARLLWAYNVRDEGRFESMPSLLDAWWLLLQDFEGLQALGKKLNFILLEHEGNSLSNLLRFGYQLEILSQVARRLGGSGNGTYQNNSDGLGSHREMIEELRSYLQDILLDRLPAFCDMVYKAIIALEARRKKNQLISPNHLEPITLYLRVLLQYRNLFLSASIKRLDEACSVIQGTNQLGADPNGTFYPTSSRWEDYKQKCDSIRGRLHAYAQACSDGKRDKLKPFVILVVGEPGTGKSQFVKSVVRSVLSDCPVEIILDLSQATSVAGYLESAWRELAKRNKRGVGLLVLEEFDSQIGDGVAQYRSVLRPFWDSQSSIVTPSGVESLDLGPYVAVCVMSKISKFAAVRRMLARTDKGADFLSRVDVVVEIPAFDRVSTQVELILAALGGRMSEAGEMRVSQLAALFLGWLPANDNFRSISKALKTVSDSSADIRYSELNIDPRIRQDFENAFMELVQVEELEPFRNETAACVRVTRDGLLLKFNREGSLRP